MAIYLVHLNIRGVYIDGHLFPTAWDQMKNAGISKVVRFKIAFLKLFKQQF